MNVGAVFGIIFAAIFIGFILAFGTGAITDIFCVGNVAQTNNAVKQLEIAVENLYVRGSEGSSDEYTLNIPDNARVCFVNSTDASPNVLGGWMPDPDTAHIVKRKIETQNLNVWVYYNCGSQEPGYRIEYLSVPSSFCASPGTSLYLENKGLSVEISKM